MPDNVAITPGAGAAVATDDVGGVQYQRMKISHGGDGVVDGDASKTSPLPSRMGASLTRDFLVAPIVATPIGFNQIIAASAGKTIKILGWAFKVTGAVSVKFRDEIGGLDLIPYMAYANNGDGWVQDIIGQPYLITSVGGNFGFTLSVAMNTTGVVFYTQE
jgi:hypothetical protein